MVWIQTNEQYFYSGTIEDIKKELKNGMKEEHPSIDTSFVDTSVFFLEPSFDEIKAMITAESDFSNKVIISSADPENSGFPKVSIFSVIYLRGKHFPYTSEQLRIGIPKEEVIYQRMGITILKPTKTFADMAGAEVLSSDVGRMLILERMGIKSIAGLFLFGVAGAGKSFFAECFAGQSGKFFVQLDLPFFMTLPSPTRSMDELFDFLEAQDESYLLLLDEIEKMFDFTGGNLIAKQVFGKLLTRLNNIFNALDNNITFVATANNITDIMKYSPEFLRKGRFDRLYFLGYPSMEDAEKIFTLYKNINKKKLSKSLGKMFDRYTKSVNEGKEKDLPEEFSHLSDYFKGVLDERFSLDELKEAFTLDFNITRNIRYIDAKFASLKVSDSDKFIYSPPEIQAVADELQSTALLEVLSMNTDASSLVDVKSIMKKLEDNDVFTYKVIRTSVPLQVSASDGISRQIAQSKSYTGKEAGSIEQFTNV